MRQDYNPLFSWGERGFCKSLPKTEVFETAHLVSQTDRGFEKAQVQFFKQIRWCTKDVKGFQ
jgi:hypothetical protein